MNKSKKKNIKIIVATHKKYQMPDDDIYFPLHVGREGKEDLGLQGDNTNDNISLKNPFFCELTGVYWAWKNLDADYVGLVHYRRYFASKIKNKDKFKSILKREELESYLNDYDILLPKKRKYYIETIYNHYKHTMHVETLDEAIKIIEESHPEYMSSVVKVMKRRSMHAFNMFIMKKQYFDEYCEWLFSILFELENRFKDKEYDTFHARFYGRVSERLLDVWLDHNKYKYKELPFIYMEKINWWKKGTGFLKAKFFGKKYDKSF